MQPRHNNVLTATEMEKSNLRKKRPWSVHAVEERGNTPLPSSARTPNFDPDYAAHAV
jgi:hypothetical protein